MSESFLSRYRSWVAVIFLGLLWFILCRHLSGEWSVNEQYSYGWFVPFFAAYLFWLRFDDRPPGDQLLVNGDLLSGRQASSDRRSPNNKQRITRTCAAVVAVAALALLAPLRVFEIGNPDWRPLSWLHALIVVSLTLIALWRAGGWPWARHFAFPVTFILVAVPWLTPIEEPIVQGLMRLAASVATEALHLFGIPAQLEGNLIRVSTGVVGVNEACSGVRSLQTSLMIGLLFGELKRLSVLRRAGLVAGAVAIALLCNFGRAFTLVWISATDSPEAANGWHDGIGYAIVGVVFIGTMGIAALLGSGTVEGRKEKGGSSGESEGSDQESVVRRQEPPDSGQVSAVSRQGLELGTQQGSLTSDHRHLTSDNQPFASPFRLSPFSFLLPLAWLLAVEASAEAWYRRHERDLVRRDRWTVRFPEQTPGFRQIEIDETAKQLLRFNNGRQAGWPLSAAEPATRSLKAMLFFFRWDPGTGSTLRARSHRPDICLPAAGWRQIGDFGVKNYTVAEGRALPFRHFAFQLEQPGPRSAQANAFFCVSEDKVPGNAPAHEADLAASTGSEWSRRDRVRVVREGLRNPGQQVMQLVLVGPGAREPAVAEAEFGKLLPELVMVGDRAPAGTD